MNTSPDILQPHSKEIVLCPPDNERLANLCGPLDKHLRQMERQLGVKINNRGYTFRIIGTPKSVDVTARVLNSLYETSSKELLSTKQIHMFLQEANIDGEIDNSIDSEVSIKTRRGIVKGRSANQKLYLKNMQSHDISFGIGPAGTGKTYLAVACAVASLESDRCRRIVLVRPAVEAGEKLGYLPGDMFQKVDPYLRPLYDALFEMLGYDRVNKYIERNIIEVAPLRLCVAGL